MSWFERIRRLPIIGSRYALGEAIRKLDEHRREIERLRARVESQEQRLILEKRKQRRLEARLARSKASAVRPGKPLTPHQQAFQHATADDYRFATVVSYPKSGRTWFSTIYFHYARLVLGATGMPQQSLHMPDRNLAFQNLLAEKAKGGGCPVCVFTHLGFSALKSFETEAAPWPDSITGVLKRPVILIARDPRDTVVSHYHHLRAVGGVLDPDLRLGDFIRSAWGIERIVRFLNMWADPLRAGHTNLHLCTYESLKRDAADTFAASMRFLGVVVDRSAVTAAVEESSFEKLQGRERANRMYQGASLEPDAFRFRQGHIGGHTRELTESDTTYINQVVSSALDSVFSMYLPAQVPALETHSKGF